MKLSPDYIESHADVRHFEPKANGHAKRAADEGSALNYRRMSDVKALPVRWLWPGRIARGKVSMIAGNPGLAKSQVTIAMAATVTTQSAWPVDGGRAELGSVVFLSAEDDAGDTIKPRLLAAGADVTKCFVIDAVPDVTNDGAAFVRNFNLDGDLHRLAAMLDDVGDVAMVVIDPLSAYMGGTDTHKNSDVRAALAPLGDLAARYGVAVVCVSHLNKGGGGEALLRVTGSLAFVAAARAAYAVVRDQEDPARRLFLPLKNNLGNDQGGLAFSVQGATVEDGIATSMVLWERDPVSVTADEAMRAVESDDGQSPREEISEWLRDLLAPGRMTTSDLQAKAKQAGFAWRSVQRVLKDGGYVSSRKGFGKDLVFYWSQPPLPSDAPYTPHTPIHASQPDVAHKESIGAYEAGEGGQSSPQPVDSDSKDTPAPGDRFGNSVQSADQAIEPALPTPEQIRLGRERLRLQALNAHSEGTA